jgi:hypothetical protein
LQRLLELFSLFASCCSEGLISAWCFPVSCCSAAHSGRRQLLLILSLFPVSAALGADANHHYIVRFVHPTFPIIKYFRLAPIPLAASRARYAFPLTVLHTVETPLR